MSKNLKKVTARLFAIQILYSTDFFCEKSTDKFINDFIERYKSGDFSDGIISDDEHFVSPDKDLLSEILNLVKNSKDDIDIYIKKYIKKNWTIDRLDPIIRSILRCGIAELINFGDIPVKVILDQYVSLTRDFYEKQEVGFVNAILDNAAKEIRNT